MKIYHQLTVTVIIVFLVVLGCQPSAAKKRKHYKNADNSADANKTKTKTKWSSSSNLSPQTKNAMVASEEHGYYVKRTFLPLDGEGKNVTALKSPPFLAIPIAWFPCTDHNDCLKLNSLALSSNEHSLQEGFLCDDDCSGPFEPICGRTSSEVAVFYNRCKLNVAKCRSHGYWSDLPYEECKTQYLAEVKYAEMKFARNPYFRRPAAEVLHSVPENKIEIVLTEDNSQEETTTTTTTEQLLIQELKDSKPLEKLEKDAKDLYQDVQSASGIFKEIKL